eukprot:3986804-Prymnesium_polylepis.1
MNTPGNGLTPLYLLSHPTREPSLNRHCAAPRARARLRSSGTTRAGSAAATPAHLRGTRPSRARESSARAARGCSRSRRGPHRPIGGGLPRAQQAPATAPRPCGCCEGSAAERHAPCASSRAA